jgi:hypothetical protein
VGIADVIRLAREDVGYTECIGPDSGCPKRPRTPGCNHTTYGVQFGFNGVAWCAIYTWSLWTRSGYGDLIPKTAGAWDMLNRAHARGWALPAQMPQVGDIPVYAFGDGHVGGIVTQVRSNGFASVEGNTARGNSGSQTNGWYVAERYRTVDQLKGIIRLPIQEDDVPVPTAEEIAAAVWKHPWNAGVDAAGNQLTETAEQRLVWASRGTAIAAILQSISDGVTTLQHGSPVTLSTTQVQSLADAVAQQVITQVGPTVASQIAVELAHRLANG